MPATEPKPTAKAPEPAPVLGDAAASSDAAVQNLLAALEIHERNDDQAAAKAVKVQLAEFGVAV